MTDFLCNICYNTSSSASIIENIEIVSNILLSVLTGVVAMLGFGCIKPLKEKTWSATFTFWSQLSVRLMLIRRWLELDVGVLDNLYSPLAKQGWSTLTPSSERIHHFLDIVLSTLEFIKNADDQMPAYQGWSEDYSSLISHLEDMVVYDISNSTTYFKYDSPVTDQERRQFGLNLCSLIDRICTNIKNKQKEIEKKIV